jgi:hypothetical protein
MLLPDAGRVSGVAVNSMMHAGEIRCSTSKVSAVRALDLPLIRPLLDSLQPFRSRRHGGEVWLEILVVRVNLATFRVVDPQGGQRPDNKADAGDKVLWPNQLDL